MAERGHDFRCRVLQLNEMVLDHVLDCLCGFRPDDIDHAVDAPVIQQRHGDTGKPIRRLSPISTAAEGRITGAVSLIPCFDQDLTYALFIACKSILCEFDLRNKVRILSRSFSGQYAR